jgi:hypothetical protein
MLMTLAVDYAAAFELEIRRRQSLAGRVRYAGVLMVWALVFLVRPGLAIQIWRETRVCTR